MSKRTRFATAADTAPDGATDTWLLPVLREIAPRADLRAITATTTGTYWEAAVAAGIATDEMILAAVASRARIRVAAALTSSLQAREHVPELLARRYGVLPLALTNGVLEVATGNPYDLDCEQTLAFVAGRRVRMALATPARIAERLEEVYRPASVVDRLLASVPRVSVEEAPPEPADPSPATLLHGARERSIVKLVDHIVAEGIAARASDIHIEAEEDAIVLRYRVDGVLRRAMSLPRAVGLPLVSRVKIMARMDIADRLRPQGGRAAVTAGGERIDLRVSTLPSAHGEKLVIRILDARGGVRSLDALGMSATDASRLRRLLDTREGLILVTGPTGSGKTTTLYAALHQMLARGLNVVTVEDPVEYRVPGLVQTQVNDKAGLTFAAALRSILRQDPDVILIGEIRDAETAAIAIQAALTGHLVFATLHTIDAASSIARLHDLGVEPRKVAASLKGILAQRLVRRVCDQCAAASDEPVPAALWDAIPSGATLSRGRGCGRCAGTGYRGRIAVVELLTATPALVRVIASSAPADRIAATARAEGMRSLWSGAVARVLDGETTPDEVARVLDADAVDESADEEDDERNGRREDVSPDDLDAFEALRSEALEVLGGARSESATSGTYSVHDDEESRIRIARSARMTRLEVGVVDVYVVDPRSAPWRVLVLQRASGTRCPGAWEAVHGHIEPDEKPEDAAVRELREETGLEIDRLYNVTVHAFYLHTIGAVEMAVVFCAFVHSDAPVTLGPEHAACEWLPLDAARDRMIWPRAAQALGEITKLLGGGDAGPAEDVLRVR